MIAIMLKAAAIKVTAIKMTRLSSLSEIKPIGHCNIAPNEITMTIKIDISKVVKPFDIAYTAPYPKSALWERPIKIAPIKPRGDITYNSFKFSLLGFVKSGASVIDSNIGNNDKDSSTETKINKSKFLGSAMFNKNCPVTPIYPSIICQHKKSIRLIIKI